MIQAEGNRISYRLPSDAELIERVAWFIRLRWIAAIFVFLLTWLADQIFHLSMPTAQLCLIGMAMVAYNLAFYLRLKALQRRSVVALPAFRRFAGLQIICDWIALILLVHYSGGMESPAIFYFIFNAIIASILLETRMAFLLAGAGILLIVGLAALEEWQILPPFLLFQAPQSQSERAVSMLISLFFTISGILISIYLASSITGRLKVRTRQLAQTKQTLENAFQKMHALNETAKAINSSLKLEEVLQTIVRHAAGTMNAKAASLRLLDEEKKYLEISASFGLSDEYLTKGKVDPQKGELDRLTLLGTPVVIMDATSDSRFQYPHAARKEGIRSVLNVPILLHQACIGVLRVYTSDIRTFSPEEIDFLMALASQGAAAIQNARAYQQLQELEQTKSRFIFTVTHELRSPVAAIQSQLAVLQDGYAGDLSIQQKELISRAGVRMAGLHALINDLLALGALKDRLPKYKHSDLDLVQILQRALETVQPQAAAKRIDIQATLPSAPLSIRAIEEDMQRLAGNLLENAVKYTPAGGKVQVWLKAQAAQITLVVSDSGIGIPPDALPHLFEEFYRAQNAKQLGVEGTGLGLSLCKHIVDRYGGSIAVQSELGKGTTFTALLPQDGKDSHGV